MPKGTKTHTTLILFNFTCKKCDIHKEFHTEKMRDKIFHLHNKFCDAEEIQGGILINFNNTKPKEKINNATEKLK